MKKSNLFILALAGAALVACNGGGGGSSSSGGGSGCSNGAATCGAPAGSVPTVYSQPIMMLGTLAGKSLNAAPTQNGTLTSTTGLYLSSAESYPLTFTVTGNTSEITVDFSIWADDPTIPVGSLPATMTPRQCVFAVSNPAPCNLSVTLGNAPVGQYKVIPKVVGGAEFSTAVVMNFQAQSQFTLPLGTYLVVGQAIGQGGGPYVVTSCWVEPMPINYLINTLNGVYTCSDARGNFPAQCYKPSDTRAPANNLPADTTYDPGNASYPATYIYSSNASWSGTVSSYTFALGYSACSGLFATVSYTYQSSSVTPMYPVVNSSSTPLGTNGANQTALGLLGGFTQ